ncbi:MAG: GDSL-type esterase/lipase family protein [Bacteroidales bacterium]|nr:GDSL-type esterase/lipase family protein [Bacteroidales bacterium]
MKSYKILIFIFTIIAILAVVAWLFPREGVKIGTTELRFPSIEEVLVREPLEAPIDPEKLLQDSIKTAELNSLKDTLKHYREVFVGDAGQFYFPDDNVAFFDNVFDAMRDAQRSHRIIRILHYGDSQIEMDRLSANLREYFQGRFGGGGPGMLPAIQTIPSAVVAQRATGDLTAYAPYGDAGERTSSGNYGIMAKNYHLGSSATINIYASKHQAARERVKKFSSVKILVNDRSGHFKASVKAKGQSEHQLESTGKGIQTLQCQLDTPATMLTLHLSGNSDIYGIMVDDGYGVNVDNIPLRGCSGTIFTQIKDTVLQRCYQLSDVGIILLQFGGNSVPAIYNDVSISKFKQATAKQIRYVKSKCPQAAVVYIGPSDMSTRKGGNLQTYPLLPQLIDSLKTAALENGAAYWDLYAAMGGKNSMIQWVRAGLAGPDYVHFTPKGAEKMGDIIVNSFDEVYQFYQMRKKIDKKQLDTLWVEK